MKKYVFLGMLGGLMLLGACRTGYTLESVEGGRVPITRAYDVHPDAAATAILSPYQARVDSVMQPVIGHAAHKLEVYRPESPLSNLIADILRSSASERTGAPVEVGVMNMGGIRNLLNEGDITVGDIYEISPFQNALAVVTLRGDDLLELFRQMAAVHGEGISGANLVIDAQGKLLQVRVGGKPVDPARTYRVATIDYLAEGNDHLEAFKKATARTLPAGAVLRDLFIEYVKRCQTRGKFVDARVEGRIVVKADDAGNGN